MAKFVVTPIQTETKSATIKPKKDVAEFLYQIGFQKLWYRRNVAQQENYRVTETNLRELQGGMWPIQPGDVVVYQTPTYAGHQVEERLAELFRRRGAFSIVLVHDVEFLRYPDRYDRARLVRFYNQFDYVLVATPAMQQALLAGGVTVPVGVSGPFDYVQDAPYRRPSYSRVCHYAGNLLPKKAGFLSRVSSSLQIHAYGSVNGNERLRPTTAASVTYYGAYDQADLAAALSNGFGLAWDESNDPSATNYDAYAQVNWPHKISLYLSLGLPVIVRSGSEVARFIGGHGLGLAADSIAQVAEMVNAVTPADYAELVDHVAAEARLIRDGVHIQTAILQALCAPRITRV